MSERTTEELYSLLKEELITISDSVWNARSEFDRTKIDGNPIPYMCMTFLEALSDHLVNVCEIHDIEKHSSV